MRIFKSIIILIFITLLSGCVKPSTSPTIVLKTAIGDRTEHAIIDIFYATDRKKESNNDIKNFYSGSRDKLHYGVVKVNIPVKNHTIGELESPSIWKLEFKENPDKHVMLVDIDEYDKSSFFRKVAYKVFKSNKKDAFIFVHGYNVTFEDAARRAAQISYDLKFNGASALFSWPSQGKELGYMTDEVNIKWAQPDIEMFLKDFAKRSNAENIYLIAHSMGNRGLTRAYISLIQKEPKLKNRFKAIILAAPDIDADVFKREIIPAMNKTADMVTLYSSSEDIALKLSKKLHNYPRAGDSGKDIIVAPGIETIDATDVRTTFLGHSYFAESKSILSDISTLINQHLKADERFGLLPVKNEKGKYWKMRK